MPQSAARRGRFGGARTPPHLATLVILAGTSVMSMNIFLPVLPALARDLGVGTGTAQYVLTLFLATTALVQLIVGPLSDRFGRRPVLLGTALTFLGATLLCVLASSIELLLIGRVLQASTAASMALSRAIIRDLYDRTKAASMIGYVTMAMSLLPMMTPTVGGVVGEVFGWRATFVVLLFVGIGVLALVWFDLGETHRPASGSASKQVQDTAELLRVARIWGYFGSATLSSGAYFSFLGGAPFVGEQVLGLTPTVLGMWFALVAIGYMIGNFLSGRYPQRFGIENMMLAGSVVAASGAALTLWLMATFPPHASFLFGPMAFVGLGNGMTLPNAAAGAVSVRPDLAGSASGVGGFLQIGGGAALATVAGALITDANQGMPLYWLMAIVSVAGALVAWWMKRLPLLEGEARD